MANALYPKAKQGLLDGSIDMDTATIHAALVRGSYNAAHTFVNDFTGAGGVIHATVALGSKTVTDGTFDAADSSFTAPAANANPHSILIYQQTTASGGAATATTQRLIAWFDSGTNLPIPSLNGGDVTITWPSPGLFSL